jgi:hypothetical protein
LSGCYTWGVVGVVAVGAFRSSAVAAVSTVFAGVAAIPVHLVDQPEAYPFYIGRAVMLAVAVAVKSGPWRPVDVTIRVEFFDEGVMVEGVPPVGRLVRAEVRLP